MRDPNEGPLRGSAHPIARQERCTTSSRRAVAVERRPPSAASTRRVTPGRRCRASLLHKEHKQNSIKSDREIIFLGPPCVGMVRARRAERAYCINSINSGKRGPHRQKHAKLPGKMQARANLLSAAVPPLAPRVSAGLDPPESPKSTTISQSFC